MRLGKYLSSLTKPELEELKNSLTLQRVNRKYMICSLLEKATPILQIKYVSVIEPLIEYHKR